jgi:hypothetical protein
MYPQSWLNWASWDELDLSEKAFLPKTWHDSGNPVSPEISFKATTEFIIYERVDDG